MGGRGGTEIETDSLGSASSIMGEAFIFFWQLIVRGKRNYEWHCELSLESRNKPGQHLSTPSPGPQETLGHCAVI